MAQAGRHSYLESMVIPSPPRRPSNNLKNKNKSSAKEDRKTVTAKLIDAKIVERGDEEVVVYRIKIHISINNKTFHSFVIEKRYSDFKDLYKELLSCGARLSVELPKGTGVMWWKRFDDQVIAERTRAFSKVIASIAPIAKDFEVVASFLSPPSGMILDESDSEESEFSDGAEASYSSQGGPRPVARPGPAPPPASHPVARPKTHTLYNKNNDRRPEGEAPPDIQMETQAPEGGGASGNGDNVKTPTSADVQYACLVHPNSPPGPSGLGPHESSAAKAPLLEEPSSQPLAPSTHDKNGSLNTMAAISEIKYSELDFEKMKKLERDMERKMLEMEMDMES